MHNARDEKRGLKPYTIAVVALASALMIASKLALALVPNVELVTLLVVVFSYVYGYPIIISTFVFCTIDILLYPTTPDVIIAYYIYWNALAYVVAMLRTRAHATACYTALAVIATLLFGIITTATYSIFYGVSFFAWYASGLPFFAIHLASSLVTVTVGFSPLTSLLQSLNRRNNRL